MTDKEKIAELQKKRKKYYQECFSSEAGQFVLDDLRKGSYMDYTTFSKDSGEMAYREGIRSVVLHIQRMIKD